MRILIIILRSAIAFVVLFLLARLMGKKHISQISYFDYVTGISIGSIAAAMSVDRSINFGDGIISLLVWSGLTISAGYLSLINHPAMKLIDGEPTLVIKNGKILESAMAKNQYNVEDLLMLLRSKGIFDLSEVEYALIETNGELSVLKKAQFQSLTPNDLHLSSSYKGLPIELIINGKINEMNLQKVNLTHDWLQNELKAKGISKLDEVIIATLDTQGNLYVDLKKD